MGKRSKIPTQGDRQQGAYTENGHGELALGTGKHNKTPRKHRQVIEITQGLRSHVNDFVLWDKSPRTWH